MGATKVVYSTKIGPQRPSGFDHGPGALVAAQGIFETSSTLKARLGTRLQVGDRVFRYALAGAAAIIPGVFCQQALVGGATTTLQTTLALTVAATAGDSRIYINALTTAQAANLFADGWACIYDATLGGPTLYRVKGNSSLAVSGVTSYIELYDGIPAALTTSSQVELIANPYKGVIILPSASTLTGPVMGVTPVYVAATYYFWLQTYGPCAILASAALDFDEYVGLSDSNAGYAESDGATANTAVMGTAMAAGTASEGSIMFLTILA